MVEIIEVKRVVMPSATTVKIANKDDLMKIANDYGEKYVFNHKNWLYFFHDNVSYECECE